jgi:hypothetical protein
MRQNVPLKGRIYIIMAFLKGSLVSLYHHDMVGKLAVRKIKAVYPYGLILCKFQ